MKNEFEEAGKKQKGNLLSEIAAFMSHNKKWWLAPIITLLLLLGVLLILGSTGAAPFIYSLF